MKILRWNSPIRTPVRYHSAETLQSADRYELHIKPCVEPDGKVHFEEHTTIRNGETLRIDIYPYDPEVSNSDLIRLLRAHIIDLN